jgi:type II secretory pathway pseudopilin PulG
MPLHASGARDRAEGSTGDEGGGARAWVALGCAMLFIILALLVVVVVPNLLVRQKMVTFEEVAVAALRAYRGAQHTFRRVDRYDKGANLFANPSDGTGFPDLWRVGGPLQAQDGSEMMLVDVRFARAASPETPRDGYWFVDIVADADGPYDFTRDCGLCAVPAVHGETTIHTFVINTDGTVYRKDNGGKPVTVFPDVEKDGWRHAGM